MTHNERKLIEAYVVKNIPNKLIKKDIIFIIIDIIEIRISNPENSHISQKIFQEIEATGDVSRPELNNPEGKFIYYNVIAPVNMLASCISKAGYVNKRVWNLWRRPSEESAFVLLDAFIREDMNMIINFFYSMLASNSPTQGQLAAPALFTLSCQKPNAELRKYAKDILELNLTFFDFKNIDFSSYTDYDDFLKKERLRFLSDPKEIPSPDDPTLAAANRSGHLAAILATLPKDAAYGELAPKLADLTREFRREIATILQPALNRHVQAMPQDNLDAKKKIGEFVNDELERFGLAVRCPNTGLPAKLKGLGGDWGGTGRFAFEVYSEGKRVRPSVSVNLPELHLIDMSPVQETQVIHQERVGPISGRAGRKRT